jgi:hypothetical protein
MNLEGVRVCKSFISSRTCILNHIVFLAVSSLSCNHLLLYLLTIVLLGGTDSSKSSTIKIRKFGMGIFEDGKNLT